MNKQIITSPLDLDIYKFFMMQVVLHKFPGAMVEYEFKCRTKNVNLIQYKEEISKQINLLGNLRFNEDDLQYLSSLGFFKSDFIEFLRIFKLNPNFVNVYGGAELKIKISGPFLHTILFETFILSIVNEIYFKKFNNKDTVRNIKRKLNEKIQLIKTPFYPYWNNFKFADFGTRRRFSKLIQGKIIKKLSEELPNNFIGTSNVYFAKKFDLKPIGTQAHEFFQACQALGPKLVNFQKFALQTWADEYRGDLGIALSDTVGFDAFLKDFDKYFSKLFDGVRHDSGDPYKWCEKLIKHYESMGIDPKTKTAVFSDGLTINSAISICSKFSNKIKTSFGIGTSLTNDSGIKPLQIVIKMTKCNGEPVAKISDSPGKLMCRDDSYLQYLKKVFKIEE